MSIAQARIAEEAVRRSGALDLRDLGLETLPEALFSLRHLRRLDLGASEPSRRRTARRNRIDARGDQFGALTKLELLSLNGADLRSLAPLRDLTWLRTLNCSNTQVSDLAPLSGLAALQSLDCSVTRVADLAPLSDLTALQSLDCSGTKVADLAPLSGLTALETLDCYDTRVADLAPLSGLTALQTLSCGNTSVADLTPLSGLTALRALDCCITPVPDLAPLSGLTTLESLVCTDTLVADLAPLSGLTALQTLVCSSTQIADLAPLSGFTALHTLDCNATNVVGLAPLSGLTALQTLVCSRTQITDLAPLSALTALQTLICGSTGVADLAPLSALTALQTLDCSGASVVDLAPLSGLAALRTLHCGGTQVADLAPLSDLTALQMLNCGGTQVADLASVSGLTALQTLNCADTQVTDLAPVSGLIALQTLDCGWTKVVDLAPLCDLTALQTLNCAGTRVADLAPLSGLTSLHTLVCTRTQITDLAPLSGLTALQWLDCSGTQVSDLAPLSGLTVLQSLDCNNCSLVGLPEPVRNLASLRILRLSACQIPGVPAEVLGSDCLAAVLAHFRDLDAGSVEMSDVKLMALGNGRVGKTQICRRLRGESYDPDELSTHGILVTSASLETGEITTRLNIWDFGGQELYHGTHALFLRTSAIFMLVWARETENDNTYDHQGVTYRNQSLSYWLSYVRHLAATDSPVLLVQTRCDRPQDEALSLPIPDGATRGLTHCVSLHYSALNNRGRDELDRRLREAVASLRERQGIAQIGIGRMHVQRALQAMRDADAAVQAEQRQYRTITQENFHHLCDEAGNVSSPGELLRFLHNAGIVFHRPGLFEDRIVLDQGWALDAIYAVFNREKCYRELKRLRGRFTRPLLEILVWADHGVAEQRLFLDMMRSCGVCFVHREGPHDDPDVTEYVAPDLLPEQSDSVVQDELAALWDTEKSAETAEFEFEMLHPGLVRGLICEIGSVAGVAALYWRGGVCGYETTTRSHALIEQHMSDCWRGRIRVQTQGGQARLLLDRMATWIEQRSGRDGLRATRLGDSARRPVITAETARPGGNSSEDEEIPATFGPVPVAAIKYFVSYARDDDTSTEGGEREGIVDRLCAAAEVRGIAIIRDKTTLRLGDPISSFMHQIGAGDRVFVILSDKYLHSPYCMFELWEIWRHSRADEADFRRRVRIYALPDAKARTPNERIRLARYWKREHDEIAAMIKEDGGEIVSTQDFAAFKLMGDFYRRVPEILATMFDTVQPQSFEDLLAYGFDDPPDGPL
jgi:internalin A